MEFTINKNNNITYINCTIDNIFVGQIKYEYYKTTKDLFDDKLTKNLSEIHIGKNPFIYLTYIFVEDRFRGKKISNKLMDKFLSLKSTSNKKILLYASPFKNDKLEPLNIKTLENFYKKFDFKIIYRSTSSSLMIK